MPEIALVREIRNEGFVLAPEFPRAPGAVVTGAEAQRSASYESPDFMCRRMWILLWSKDDQGRLAKIDGHFHVICL